MRRVVAALLAASALVAAGCGDDEAQITLDEAKEQATRIVANARREAKTIRETATKDAAAEREELEAEIAELRKDREGVQESLKNTRSKRDGVQSELKDLRREAEGVRAEIKKNSFSGDGTYIVGEDINPGTYRAEASPSGNCYYERLNDLEGNIDSIITNENTSGPVVLNVAPSDYAIQVSGCAEFKKAG